MSATLAMRRTSEAVFTPDPQGDPCGTTAERGSDLFNRLTEVRPSGRCGRRRRLSPLRPVGVVVWDADRVPRDAVAREVLRHNPANAVTDIVERLILSDRSTGVHKRLRARAGEGSV